MSKKIEWYTGFVDRKHRVKSNELDVLFRYTAKKGINSIEAVGRLASESSVGTWTTLPGMPKKQIEKLKACVYKYDKEYARISYPLELWEPGSVPQLMSGIGGNIFGMKAVKNLRLLDAEIPKAMMKEYKGPVYGKTAIRRIFRKKKGPITSTVIKPKLGYTAKQHAEIGYKIYSGGIDCIKDDENLTSQRFNRFEERVKLLARARDKAEKETGDVKDAYPNITSGTLKEMERRIGIVHEHGFNYFMIDVVLAGFTAVQTAGELARDYKMAVHGHRAMHAAFTRNPRHGISMLFLAKLARIMGVDQIHTGTIIGKLEGDKKEILAMKEMLLSGKVKEIKNLRMKQDFGNMKGTMPVASGGLHPGLLPELLRLYGTTDIAVQVGGGVLGHPKGAKAGAKAVVQAIEAYKQGMGLDEYAKKHRELREAMEKWGYLKPV